MEPSFTRNQLIRCIYKEVSQAEQSMMEELIDLIPELQTEYNELKKSVDLLSEIELKPSNRSLEHILRWSRSKPVVLSL